MKRLQFLFIVVVYISITAQPNRDGAERMHSGPKPIYIESHLIPSDSINICYISYKVPYSNLVFIKEGYTFNGGLTFRIEATGKEGVLGRESTHDKVRLANYDDTNRQDKFLEGVLSFPLSKSSATINPIIEIDNTNRQVPLRPFNVEKSDYEFIVVKFESGCTNSHGYSLINFENSIPFDDEDHKLMIPIFNKKVDKIVAKVSQNGKDILKKELIKVSTLSLSLEECRGNISLVNNPGNEAANIFFLHNFATLLNEGPFEVTIMSETDSILFQRELNVSWINKPAPLMNPKFAFGLLELMEDESKLDQIYDEAGGDYLNAINLFWDKYDPDGKTAYNPLMYEFYSRAETALKEYSEKGSRFDALTDRAKIFIKYGEPSEVDRYYSDKDEITEVWKYLSPKTQFVFVDASGLGNYKLVN